jgi:hypothetical protein
MVESFPCLLPGETGGFKQYYIEHQVYLNDWTVQMLLQYEDGSFVSD